ncbi:MAG: hypothetical protein JNM78_20365 [Cyclobacteriaceae bacterium]|nr:hypothetical protein [Cyclobacteriaceae bacterium]
MLSKKFFLLITLVCSHVFVHGQSTSEEYGIVLKNEKITLYERWIFFPDTNVKARQIQGVFETFASMDKILTTVVDETKIKEWQTNLIKYQYIPGSDSIWHTYALYKMPWPLNNQDYLLKYTLRKRTDNLMVLSFQDSLDERLAPLNKNVDRKPTIGQWQFEKLSNGKTQVIYTIVTKPSGYPRFITDPIVRNNLMSIINNLIEVAEK